MHGPAVIKVLGGGTRGDGKGELKRLHGKVSDAKWVALSLLVRRENGLEVACRTDRAGKGREMSKESRQLVGRRADA